MPKASPSTLIIDHFAAEGRALVRAMETSPVLPPMRMIDRVSSFDSAATMLRRAKLNATDRTKALRVVTNLKKAVPKAWKGHRAIGGNSGSSFHTGWFRYLAKRVSEPY